jgi:sugar (pentulose or hexulose) kinase
MMRHIAVLDIGKTNAKLALVELPSLREIAVRTRPNLVLKAPPYPQYDLDGHWRFFCDGLRQLHRDHGIDGVAVTTHGAALTLIGDDGAALPMLDYEATGPDSLSAAYEAIRPDFSQTGSPRLAAGLNLGAQLHWQFAMDPGLKQRVRHIVTYPQYWGFRLTGALACDITSLGCHTDLWLPEAGVFSGLVDALGIRDLLAPARRPNEVLGGISAQAAQETGLPEGLPVCVGIHDSNASLYPHLLSREGAFSVVSTGTWVIIMAMRGASPALDPRRDTLINVNGLGEAVPSARFMGGREFSLINQDWSGTPSAADRQTVLERPILLLPAVEAGSGPFAGRAMRWTEPAQTEGQRFVALSYYLALMTYTGLQMIGSQGPCVIEGPFAKNPEYLAMLASLWPQGIEAKASATGTSAGAALLFAQSAPLLPAPSRPLGDARLASYARLWADQVKAGEDGAA